MWRLLILFIFLLASVDAFAARGKKEEDVLKVEPYLFVEQGEYKFIDDTDSGKFNSTGVGFRGGYSFGLIYVGAEANYSLTGLYGGQDLPQATRELYPIADDYMLSYGATLMLLLGPLKISGTYFFESELVGQIKNDILFLPNGEYKYLGSGTKISVDLKLFSGLSIGAGLLDFRYDRYSLDITLNTLTAVTEAARPELQLTGYQAYILYNIPLDLGK